MTVWVLLLRGVNVGGTGKLPMADLRALLEQLGAGNVATYIQSGNAVFSGDLDPDALAARIEDAVEARFGFRRPALVLPGERLREALDRFPFEAAFDDPKTGHVWFYGAGADPDPALMQEVAFSGEAFGYAPGCFFLHTPDGLSNSALPAKIEKLPGVPTTARNLNTVMKLAEMVDALERATTATGD